MKTFSAIMLACLSLYATQADANESLCRSIEGNKGQILRMINDRIAGMEYTISKRKSLVIKKARSIHDIKSNGRFCRIKVDLDAKLKRKLRRNASGRIVVRGDLELRYLRGNWSACVHNSKVTSVKLSHTARIGEGVYRKVANKTLPKKWCLPVDIHSIR